MNMRDKFYDIFVLNYTMGIATYRNYAWAKLTDDITELPIKPPSFSSCPRGFIVYVPTHLMHAEFVSRPGRVESVRLWVHKAKRAPVPFNTK